MSFTRLLYDQCNINQNVNESTNPLGYSLFSPYNTHPERCFKNTEASKKELLPEQRVNIESDLRNLDRKTSRCNVEKYNPSCNNGVECPAEPITKLGSNFQYTPPEACHDLFSIIENNVKKPEIKSFNPKEYSSN